MQLWMKINSIFSDIAEDEQLIRRNLMSLHRAVNQKDRILLAQLTQAGIDMTLPLKGVTALSLALKSKEMFILVLDALKQTQQIRKYQYGFILFFSYFYYENYMVIHLISFSSYL